MSLKSNEILSYLGSADLTDDEFLEHYGIPRRSGRYPWGSGEDPQQRTGDFLGRIDELKKKGWKETPENIKKEFGLTTSQYRIEKSISNDERKCLEINKAKSLKQDGLSNTDIGKKMGVNESTVRGWFAQEEKARYNQAKDTADFLRDQVDKKRMIDVGKNTEFSLNVSREKLDTALYLLERDGYHVYGGRVPQPTNKNQMTTLKVLAKPEVNHKEIFDYDKINTIEEYISRDNGKTYEKKFHYPTSIDSKRVKVLLKDEIGPDGLTGEKQDGVIQLRRGVQDLDLGGSKYSQVRILVDGNKYLKGMAVYSDNMPDGYDIIFNSNKSNREDAFKKIKNDPENPFGSAIKDADQGGQYWYIDKKTGEKKLGAINKRADEGDWTEWSDTLPSQFLSKQAKPLIKKQLDLAKANKQAEYDEIMSLENPTIKKYYLNKFADSCDSAAVDLKAAALPGQKYHVIIPINSLKDDEIYAPQYKPGDKVALVRYPHGGTFEIPILTVTDKNSQAKKTIGTTSIDAVGITKKVADRLSGADFDGDTVMVIPTHDKKGKVKISSQPELPGLKGFDSKSYIFDNTSTDKNGNKHYYRNGREIKIMKNTNTQMGVISNLITDMTLQGANNDELASAVRHSMVVIDAEKHKLDYKQSYIDNNIAALQKKYQPKIDEFGNINRGGGATTIISKSKGQLPVIKRKGQAKINIKGKSWYDPTKPEGSLLYTNADDKDIYYALDKYNPKTGTKTIQLTNGKTVSYDTHNKEDVEKYTPIMKKDNKGNIYFTNKDGSMIYKHGIRTIASTNMAETDDAMSLVSNFKHPKEILYADYANSMKALANQARKSMVTTGNLRSDPQARKTYLNEVSSLEAKLNDALKNSVKERMAVRLTAYEINKRKKEDPTLNSEDIRKLSQRTQSKYREQVGSITRKNRSIKITDREWEAIQAGAISENKLKQILSNSDPDILRARAMPKANKNSISSPQVSRIKAMSNSNFTIAQIAEKMNLSTSVVSKYLKGVK